MAFAGIKNLVIKKKTAYLGTNPGVPHHRHTRYQLSYDGKLKKLFSTGLTK
jgi:hypothetical protein